MLTMHNLDVVQPSCNLTANKCWMVWSYQQNERKSEGNFNVIEAAKTASTTCALINFIFFTSSLRPAKQLEYVEARDSWLFKRIGCVQSVHIAICEWTLRRYCEIIRRRRSNRSGNTEPTNDLVTFYSISGRNMHIRARECWKRDNCERRSRTGCQAKEVGGVRRVFGYFSEWYHQCSDRGNRWEHWFAHVWMLHPLHIHQPADFGADSRTCFMDCVASEVSIFH